MYYYLVHKSIILEEHEYICRLTSRLIEQLESSISLPIMTKDSSSGACIFFSFVTDTTGNTTLFLLQVLKSISEMSSKGKKMKLCELAQI